MADPEDHRLIVGGVDVCERFGLVMLDSSTFEPPEPKTYTVDIPGGNGVIDLTEALTGDVAYKQRNQTMEFACEDGGNWMERLRGVYSMLHGRALDYELSFDPGYTYHGRFSVSSESYVGVWGRSVGHVVVKVAADPYKRKQTCSYRLNATGGRSFNFWGGRRPVHPTIECENVCWVTWGGETIVVPAGTYVLRDVVFREGVNEIYINSQRLWTETWADVGEGGADAATWAGCAGNTWDDLQRLGLADAEDVPQSWGEVSLDTWAGLKSKTWRDLDFRRTDAAQGSADVYLTYDWEDL